MVVSGYQRDSGGGDHGWWLRERERKRERGLRKRK